MRKLTEQENKQSHENATHYGVDYVQDFINGEYGMTEEKINEEGVMASFHYRAGYRAALAYMPSAPVVEQMREALDKIIGELAGMGLRKEVGPTDTFMEVDSIAREALWSYIVEHDEESAASKDSSQPRG